MVMWWSIGTVLLSTVCATGAAIFIARTYGTRYSKKQLQQVQTELIDLASAFDGMQTTQKRMNARLGMREAREKQAETSSAIPTRRPGESKAAMRRALGVPDSPIALLQENMRRAGAGSRN